jgi:hypothetical protein
MLHEKVDAWVCVRVTKVVSCVCHGDWGGGLMCQGERDYWLLLAWMCHENG